MSCLKAAEAGADAIDTAISPFAQGASLPPTESMVAALEGTPYDTKLNPAKLGPIRAAALKLREKYTENGILATELLGVDITTLLHQAPGAVISGLRGELEELGKLHLLDKVMREIPNVRKDCGDPPMSAPIGQIIATQSALNVIKSGRYKMITREFRGLIRGEYGETPSPVDPEFRKSIIGEDEIIDCRPADLIPPEMEKLRGGLPEMYNERDVDILTFSQFPASALKFFERRSNRKYGVDGKYSDKKTKVHPV
jgi:oxaloacetate decarboxylase alpha subunit